MIDTLDEISLCRKMIDDGYGFTRLKEHIQFVNASPEQTVEALRTWRATNPEAARIWPFLLGGLLYTPRAVPPLDDSLLDAITALDTQTNHTPAALRRLPKGLASVFDAEVVVTRLSQSLATLLDTPDATTRVEHLASLAEHALQAFDQAVRPETKVVYQQHWMRDLASSMRTPLAHIVDSIVTALQEANVDRGALFLRLWAWLRMGWLDEFRYVKFDPRVVARQSDWSGHIASILDTNEAVQSAVNVLRGETKTVQASPTFRPLLFTLLSRLEEPDAMKEALPASPTWRHHEAIANAYEKRERPDEAIAYLKSLRESPDRDACLQRLVRATASADDAFATERPHPANLHVLMSRYGKTQSELIDVGIERMRRGEADDWLDFLVLQREWKRALLVTKHADAENVLRLLDTDLPRTAAHDLARTALEHAFDARAVWPDAARAKESIARLLERALHFAADAKARTKVLKQTRTRTQRVITKGSDFFTRELAFALDEAITEHEASMR